MGIGRDVCALKMVFDTQRTQTGGVRSTLEKFG